MQLQNGKSIIHNLRNNKMKFKKKIQIMPAFDKRHPNPGKNYGIHGCNMLFTLIGEHGAVTFTLFTNWHLPHVAEELKDKAIHPIPADIGYHSFYSMHEDQIRRSEICEYIGVPCYQDGSSIQSRKFFDELTSKGLNGLWKKMIVYYKDRFKNHELLTENKK